MEAMFDTRLTIVFIQEEEEEVGCKYGVPSKVSCPGKFFGLELQERGRGIPEFTKQEVGAGNGFCKAPRLVSCFDVSFNELGRLGVRIVVMLVHLFSFFAAFGELKNTRLLS